MPVRRRRGGAIEVLLVTSRETGRWVIPKGWPWPKKEDRDAAAGEAREEAGVEGRVEKKPFGAYEYAKRQTKKTVQLPVDVYLLWVSDEHEDWPERAERRRMWYSPEGAAEAVEEPELKELLRSLSDLPRTRGR
jgi:ADP-ribose pyrophosphatase YjhB (NUDIX family)